MESKSRGFAEGTGTAGYIPASCDFPASNISVVNDSLVPTDELEFSFDGVKIAGKVLGGETFTYEHMTRPAYELYVKGNGIPFRVFFWN